MTELVTVRLVGVPVEIHRRAGDHQDTLARELALVDVGAEADVSERLAALTDDLRQRFGAFTGEQREALLAADERGDATIDLAYELPAEAADASERLGALLDEVDELCRTGELVTLVTPPDLLAYRRWILGEFVEQIRSGREARPWDVSLVTDERTDAVDVTAAGAAPVDAGEPLRVAADLDLLGAPRLRSAIAARLEAGATSVVVDLTGVEFIDSVGLSLLLTTRERCRALGGSFEVVGAGENALRLFETAGVHSLLVREA